MAAHGSRCAFRTERRTRGRIAAGCPRAATLLHVREERFGIAESPLLRVAAVADLRDLVRSRLEADGCGLGRLHDELGFDSAHDLSAKLGEELHRRCMHAFVIGGGVAQKWPGGRGTNPLAGLRGWEYGPLP